MGKIPLLQSENLPCVKWCWIQCQQIKLVQSNWLVTKLYTSNDLGSRFSDIKLDEKDLVRDRIVQRATSMLVADVGDEMCW